MLYHEPPFLHSTDAEGRHWLTTAELQPLQIWPVAANHCRAGHFLARVVRAKLAAFEQLPTELLLTRDDVRAVPALAHRYPELTGAAGAVRVRIVIQRGPPRNGSDNNGHDAEFSDDEEMDAAELEALDTLPDLDSLKQLAAALGIGDMADAGNAGGGSEFVTPQPPNEWQGSYDDWIVAAARGLGLDARPARGPEGYDEELQNAIAEARRRLPEIRERFIAGMDGLMLGLKIGLTSSSGGTEFVWVTVLDWSRESVAACRLESEPRECPGYSSGQRLEVAVAEVIDYVIGSQEAGVVDPGFTERIAEDYGLIVT